MIIDGKNLDQPAEKPSLPQASIAPSSKKSNVKSGADPDEQIAWQIVQESRLPEDWKLQKPVWRSQSLQPYWNSQFILEGQAVGKLKVSLDPNTCEVVEFAIPKPKVIQPDQKQRLNITPWEQPARSGPPVLGIDWSL